jgi:hypothetical protein
VPAGKPVPTSMVLKSVLLKIFTIIGGDKKKIPHCSFLQLLID